VKDAKKAAILCELAESLQQKGSWCGETHLQKSTYFLQELLEVPLGFEFILYKHGPFSFEFRDFLASMRADELIENKARPNFYGPTLQATEVSREHRKRYPLTLRNYRRFIDFASDKLGGMNVSELEQLATALFVIRNEPEQKNDTQRSIRINQLKPHVSVSAAQRALETCHGLIASADLLKAQAPNT